MTLQARCLRQIAVEDRLFDRQMNNFVGKRASECPPPLLYWVRVTSVVGSGDVVPLQLLLEERACPEPQRCAISNPLTRFVLGSIPAVIV